MQLGSPGSKRNDLAHGHPFSPHTVPTLLHPCVHRDAVAMAPRGLGLQHSVPQVQLPWAPETKPPLPLHGLEVDF